MNLTNQAMINGEIVYYDACAQIANHSDPNDVYNNETYRYIGKGWIYSVLGKKKDYEKKDYEKKDTHYFYEFIDFERRDRANNLKIENKWWELFVDGVRK